MIRHATEHDIPEILRMAKQFVAISGIDVPFDETTCAKTAEGLISGLGVLFIGDGGMIGGVIYPHFFNESVLMAQELFWWVDRDKRGTSVGKKLIEAFESWAIDQGATNISMVALATERPEALGRIYRRRGYKPMESTFVRRLWQ